MSWKKDLKNLFNQINHQNTDNSNDEKICTQHFLVNIVKPSFEKIQKELEKYGRESTLTNEDDFSSLTVKFEGEKEFYYEIKVREENNSNDTVFTVQTSSLGDNAAGEELKSYPKNDIYLISENEIINAFVKGYSEHMLRNS